MLDQIKQAIDKGTKITKIGTLEVDASISRTPRYEATLTEHPIEDGADIADHHAVLPVEFSIEGYIVPTSLKTKYPVETTISAVKARIDGSDVLKEAEEYLLSLLNNHEKFSVETPKRSLHNMMITSLYFPEDNSLGNRLFFDLTCKHVVIVSVSHDNLLILNRKYGDPNKDGNGKKAKTKQAQPKENKGKASNRNSTPAEQTKGKSILHSLLF